MTAEIRQKKALNCQRSPPWSSRKLFGFRQLGVRKDKKKFNKIWPRTNQMGYIFKWRCDP